MHTSSISRWLRRAVFATALAIGSAAAMPPTAQAGPDTGDRTAGKPGPTKRASRHRTVRVRPPVQRIRKFDFTGDKVDGTLVRPDTENVTGRGNVEHKNLIRFRTHFLREVARSAENF